MGTQPARLSVLALAVTAVAMLGLMAAIFLFGIWSNTGRIAGAEHYASSFASVPPLRAHLASRREGRASDNV